MRVSPCILLLVVTMAAAAAAAAKQVDKEPAGKSASAAALLLPPGQLKKVAVPPVDYDKVAAEDAAAAREKSGIVAPRFALSNSVAIGLDDGTWETTVLPLGGSEVRVWRVIVQSPGAKHMNLGFTRFRLPEGVGMYIYDEQNAGNNSGKKKGGEEDWTLGPFTSEDNAPHGQLWTQVLHSDRLVVELNAEADNAFLQEEGAIDFELGVVNVGYRGFDKSSSKGSGKGQRQRDLAGSCNVDVACDDGDGWRSEIASVGVISTGGDTFCTGSMLNNANGDGRPYFLTANHCMGSNDAPSLVVYWNWEAPACDGNLYDGYPENHPWEMVTRGSTLRARSSGTDLFFVELASSPPSEWGVTYAGWDKSGTEASTAVAIHHPNTEEKKISFSYGATTTTRKYKNKRATGGGYVRVSSWDSGTTEGGSSGSPLFDQNHRVIGQLFGGGAACGNTASDWYGKFAESWPSLSSWLDPESSGAEYVDTLAPGTVSTTTTTVIASTAPPTTTTTTTSILGPSTTTGATTTVAPTTTTTATTTPPTTTATTSTTVTTDPPPSCSPKGSPCSNCCSNQCKGPSWNRSCK